MRITELFESGHFDDANFVKDDEDGKAINFDLADDLLQFMNQDDDVYRRHVYPLVAKCTHHMNAKRNVKPSFFKPAVQDSYKIYIKKFPIRELPDDLDEKMYEEVCKKMHEEVCKDIKANNKEG
jgi:hypothetical protein